MTKSGAMPEAACKLDDPMIHRAPVMPFVMSLGTRRRTFTTEPSQLNAVRRVSATTVCPLDSRRISTNCTVAFDPQPDMTSSMTAKWNAACTGMRASSTAAITTTTHDPRARMPRA
jgi:hypothetical protein